MLYLTVPSRELFDEATSTFSYTKEENLQLEHSLVSLSKWESKWCKPFLAKEYKTDEETRDYIRCMTINTQPSTDVYRALTNTQIKEIAAYIDAPMTATTFSKAQLAGSNREIITSELIYYWLIAQQIPFECQKWHLNRLLTLIRVCSIKNSPPKKMGRQSIQMRNKELNEQRRKQINSRG
jgi:hypothetical protein